MLAKHQLKYNVIENLVCATEQRQLLILQSKERWRFERRGSLTLVIISMFGGENSIFSVVFLVTATPVANVAGGTHRINCCLKETYTTPILRLQSSV